MNRVTFDQTKLVTNIRPREILDQLPGRHQQKVEKQQHQPECNPSQIYKNQQVKKYREQRASPTRRLIGKSKSQTLFPESFISLLSDKNPKTLFHSLWRSAIVVIVVCLYVANSVNLTHKLVSSSALITSPIDIDEDNINTHRRLKGSIIRWLLEHRKKNKTDHDGKSLRVVANTLPVAGTISKLDLGPSFRAAANILPVIGNTNDTNNSLEDINSSTIETKIARNLTILEYINQQDFIPNYGNLILLTWDETGKLETDRVQKSIDVMYSNENQLFYHDVDWLDLINNTIIDVLKQTKVSTFGSAAFLLVLNQHNSNSIKFKPYSEFWSNFIEYSPIPIFAFNVPNNMIHNKKIFLVPHPYDFNGEHNTLLQRIANVNDTEIDEFIPHEKRLNELTWVGVIGENNGKEHHHEADTSRLALRLMDYAKEHRYKLPWLNATREIDFTPSVETGLTGLNNSNEGIITIINDLVQHKYILDIGGDHYFDLSSKQKYYDSMLWKVCSGSLIFQAESYTKNWWNWRLESFTHFVPVQRSFEDLQARWSWVHNAMEKATNIAIQGRAFCLEHMISPEKVMSYQKYLMIKLPTASEEIVQEARDILDGKFGLTKVTSNIVTIKES